METFVRDSKAEKMSTPKNRFIKEKAEQSWKRIKSVPARKKKLESPILGIFFKPKSENSTTCCLLITLKNQCTLPVENDGMFCRDHNNLLMKHAKKVKMVEIPDMVAVDPSKGDYFDSSLYNVRVQKEMNEAEVKQRLAYIRYQFLERLYKYLELTPTLLPCDGCKVASPSQFDHDCMTDPDTQDKINKFYRDKAIEGLAFYGLINILKKTGHSRYHNVKLDKLYKEMGEIPKDLEPESNLCPTSWTYDVDQMIQSFIDEIFP